MALGTDTRAASIAVNHALSIGITALLMSGLLIGAGQLVDRQQERVVRAGLEDVGEGLLTDLARADRAAAAGGTNGVVSRTDYPETLGGTTYDVGLLVRDGRAVLSLRASDPAVSTRFAFGNASRICGRAVDGGPVVVAYDPDDGCLTVEPPGERP